MQRKFRLNKKQIVYAFLIMIVLGFLNTVFFYVVSEKVSVFDNTKWSDRTFHILNAQRINNRTTKRYFEAWNNTNTYNTKPFLDSYAPALHVFIAWASRITCLSEETVFSVLLFSSLFLVVPCLQVFFVFVLTRNWVLSLVSGYFFVLFGWFQRYMIIGLLPQIVVTLCMVLWFLIIYGGSGLFFLPVLLFVMCSVHRYGVYLGLFLVFVCFFRFILLFRVRDRGLVLFLSFLVLLMLCFVSGSVLSSRSREFSNAFTNIHDSPHRENMLISLMSALTPIRINALIPFSFTLLFISLLPISLKYYESYITMLALLLLGFVDVHNRTMYTATPLIFTFLIINSKNLLRLTDKIIDKLTQKLNNTP